MGGARLWVKAHDKKRYVIALRYEGEQENRYIVATDMTWRMTDIVSAYTMRWLVGVSRLRTLHLVGESPTEVKDSSLVAWEASWRESKTMEPSDNILRKEYAQCTRL
jgi:hypothetical protein